MALFVLVLAWFGLELRRDGADVGRTETSEAPRVDIEDPPAIPEEPRIAADESPPVRDTVAPTQEPDGDRLTAVTIVVRDDAGNPLPRIHVKAASLDRWDQRDQQFIFPRGVTDADGHCRLEVLPGEYFLQANSREDRDPRFTSAFFDPIAANGEPVEHVFVLSGSTGIVDVIVRDDLGAPVPGIEIRGPFDAIGKTDANGAVRFQNLGPGPQSFSIDDRELGHGHAHSCRESRGFCKLEAGGSGTISFELERNGAIEIAVPECGAAGKPAELIIDPVGSQDQSMRRFSGAALHAESTVVANLVPGRYQVNATCADACSGYVRERIEIEVTPGATARLDLPIVDGPRRLAGIVLDHLGNPRANAWMSVTSREGNDANGSPIRKTTTTNGEGRFTVLGLPPGGLRVFCDASRTQGQMVAHFGEFDRSWLEVSSATDFVELRLEAGCVIRGVLEGDPQLVENVHQVAIDRLHGPSDTWTYLKRRKLDDGGVRHEFEFANLRRGKYRLCAGGDFDDPQGPIVDVVVAPESPTTQMVEIVLRVEPPAKDAKK